ncbi:hypothetical protein [Streptomyces ferrugineus]|uniref:hypothetical protein n=1 Tax=Streptomyces ferrugineus TaxID=1413221 RepID=UPI00389A4A4E
MAVHFDEGGDANRSASPVEMLLISELTLLTLGLGLSRGDGTEVARVTDDLCRFCGCGCLPGVSLHGGGAGERRCGHR